MSKVVWVWIIGLFLLTGYGVYATFSNDLIQYADESDSLREDSVTGKRPLYFYKRMRGPRGVWRWKFGK